MLLNRRILPILALAILVVAVGMVGARPAQAQTPDPTFVNIAPAFAAATADRDVDENVGAGTRVGAPVTATDADGDSLTYTLGGTDAASFAIGTATGQITVGPATTPDYETTATYAVAVTATDSFGAIATVIVTIEVQDLREAGVLGRIVISVGSSGMTYGYDSGSYGTLDSGNFPGNLFQDGLDRTVDAIYEDGDGHWSFTYSGGVRNDWITDDALNEIVVTVTYDDGIDTRAFVLGGFIDSRPGARGLLLSPPLPSRDWDSHNGQEVGIEFSYPRSQLPAPVIPAGTMEPPAVSGSLVDFLLTTTPGGGVVFQSLLTIFVFSAYLFSVFKRSTRPQAFEVLLAGIVLCLTPWVPVIWGIGDLIAGVIIVANVANGAFVYKAFFARTEG